MILKTPFIYLSIIQNKQIDMSFGFHFKDLVEGKIKWKLYNHVSLEVSAQVRVAQR